MNKFKKVGLTALAASLISVSANAVEISGGAGLTFSGGGSKLVGNGWGMNDALDFSWGGELDNGWTVDLAFKLDNSDGAASQISPNILSQDWRQVRGDTIHQEYERDS